MGCCIMAQMENHIQKTVETQRTVANQQEAAKSAAPYISATGEVIVPMNGMTGQFPAVFPVWLNGRATPTEYQAIITRLNGITMPAFTAMIQQSDAMVKDMTSMMGGAMVTPGKMQDFQKKQMEKTSAMNVDMVTMTRNVEAALYEFNTGVLKGKGLTMLSMLSMYANVATMQQQQQMQMNGMNMGATIEKGVKIVIDQNVAPSTNTASTVAAVTAVNNSGPALQYGNEGALPNYAEANGAPPAYTNS